MSRDNLIFLITLQILFGDFWGLNEPNNVLGPTGTSNEFFLNVYDWDTVIVDSPDYENSSRVNGSNLVSTIELCSGFYPCALTISGAQENIDGAHGTLWQEGTGTIICVQASGCTGVQILLLKCFCQGNSKDPVLQVQHPLLCRIHKHLHVLNDIYSLFS